MKWHLSNYDPVPVLSLAVPVLSLVVHALSLVVPVLCLAVHVLSLAAPLLSSVIVVVGQKKSVAALCSLNLTMVKTEAKLQIQGIKGGFCADQDGCNGFTNVTFVVKDDKTIETYIYYVKYSST